MTACVGYPICTSVEDYLVDQFKCPEISDVTIAVLEVGTRRGIKTYHLHRFVLGQASFLRTGLCNRGWQSAQESEMEVELYEANWITEDITDICFEMFYTPDLKKMTERISENCIQLHYLCKKLGFDRGKIFCEKLIIDGMHCENMMDILNYCTAGDECNEPILSTCMQWVKMFMFLMQMVTAEHVKKFTFPLLERLILAPDIIYFNKSLSTLINIYEKTHQSELENVTNKKKFERLRKYVISTRESFDDHYLAGNSNVYRIVHYFARPANWKNQYDRDDPRMIKRIEDFAFLSCNWTAVMMHNYDTDVSWLAFTMTRHELPIIKCDLRINVHVIHKKGTHRIEHVGTLISNRRLDLDGISNEARDDAFVITAGDSAAEMLYTGFVIDIEVRDAIRITTPHPRERKRGNTW